MYINLPKRVLEKMTTADLALVGRDHYDRRGLDNLMVSLRDKPVQTIADIRGVMERLRSEGSRQTGPIIRDIDQWLRVLSTGNVGVGDERPRTLRAFSDLLTEYIRQSPGFRVYEQVPSSHLWVAHYVNYIGYEREHRDGHGNYIPAKCTMDLLHWELGHQHALTVTFRSNNVDARTVAQSLAEAGYVIETDDHRRDYLETLEKFNGIFDDVGRQYLARGYGVGMGRYYSLERDSGRIPLMYDGIPAKVVIDVVKEDGDESGGSRYSQVRPNFWESKKPESVKPEDSDDLPTNSALADGKHEFDDAYTNPEVPIHPLVPIYDLGRHYRYKTHVDGLEPYQFNHRLGDNLILPPVTKNIVNTLVGQGRVSFEDIIEGKGSGVCVLLGGPPGVGKTLTAEVFAEATERPLLSVQAAQLGTSAGDIEKNLMSILRRANRWNAVVLLDEADVYISERGTNIAQNAIVAAFLRVLERHTSTIFMTTNRANDVDDAITSRCIARLDYGMPDSVQQKAIWHVLNKLNQSGLTNEDIDQITAAHTGLSGRDIKQLLKLATLYAANRGHAVNVESVDFVRQFLPVRI